MRPQNIQALRSTSVGFQITEAFAAFTAAGQAILIEQILFDTPCRVLGFQLSSACNSFTNAGAVGTDKRASVYVVAAGKGDPLGTLINISQMTNVYDSHTYNCLQGNSFSNSLATKTWLPKEDYGLVVDSENSAQVYCRVPTVVNVLDFITLSVNMTVFFIPLR